MLVRTTRNYSYEGKASDLDITLSVREMGDKSLLDAIEIQETGEQKFEIYRGEELVSNFTSKQYENDDVDLTLKMLKSKVVKIDTTENYLKVRGTRKGKNSKGEMVDISCFFDNYISGVVKIVIE